MRVLYIGKTENKNINISIYNTHVSILLFFFVKLSSNISLNPMSLKHPTHFQRSQDFVIDCKTFYISYYLIRTLILNNFCLLWLTEELCILFRNDLCLSLKLLDVVHLQYYNLLAKIISIFLIDFC